jgi:pimeloyl-ACP methyl ester carboxylesterase
MFAERVDRLALVASRLGADAPDAARNRYELADRTERSASIDEIVASFLPRLFAPGSIERFPGIADGVEAVMRVTDPRGAAAMLRGMALRDEAFDIAPDLTMPVAVIAGTEDRIVPLQEARDSAAAFVRGRLIAIEGAGHMPMLEAPDRVAAAIEELLAEPVLGPPLA